MSYARKSLVTGERIVYEARFHWTSKLAAVLCLPFVVGLFMLIRIWTTEMAVTNRRIIYKRGWIARVTDEINLNRLEEVNLQQSVAGRLLGYGKVICQGTGVGEIELPTIDDPLRFRKELQEAQVQAERR